MVLSELTKIVINRNYATYNSSLRKRINELSINILSSILQGIHMPTLHIKLHQSLRLKDQPYEFEGEYLESTILEAINDLFSNYVEIRNLCLEDGKRKPGLLYLAGKTELSSMGLLNHKLEKDLDLRIIPILHGGIN